MEHLASFQPLLMKIYFHSGLKQLAQASGFRSVTLASLEKCSNFAGTHHFSLQAWQAMYRALIAAFNPEDIAAKEFKIEDTELQSILNTMETFFKAKQQTKKLKLP